MDSESEQTKRSSPTQLDVDDFKTYNNYLHTGRTSLHPASFFSHTDNFLTSNRMGGPWAQSINMFMEQHNLPNNEKSTQSDSNKIQPLVNPMMKLNPKQKDQQLLHLLQRAKRENWNDIFVFLEQLETIPNSLFEIQSLMLVDLRGNFLETVSVDIQRLSMLEELYLDSNKLKEIPPQLAKLPSLRILTFSKNKLKQIPKELATLTNLTKLDVSYNLLTEIPVEFAVLANRPQEQPRFVMIIEHNPLIDLAPALYSVISNVFTPSSNPGMRIPISLPFPTQIGNLRLFLGDNQCLTNNAALHYRKISHVVIAASEMMLDNEQQFVYSHLNIPIVDEAKSILMFLKNETLFQLIREASHDTNKGVLICCQNGATRSVAIAIGFLMKLWSVNAAKATQTLQIYYPLIHLTPEVMQQLQEYQQYLENQDANSLAETFAMKL